MKVEKKVIRKQRRAFNVRYPLRLKHNQLVIVKPIKGKPYQLVEGDIITTDFLRDTDIEEVRLIHMDIWNAVYTVLLKAKTIDPNQLKELQEKNGYEPIVRVLASRLLNYIAEGNFFERDGGLHQDACAFGEYDGKGKCIKSGLDYAPEDRTKAIILAAQYDPSIWRQTSAILYENYRTDSDNFDAEEMARIDLKYETEEDDKEYEWRMMKDWDDFIKREEQEKKEKHKKKLSNVVTLVKK